MKLLLRSILLLFFVAGSSPAFGQLTIWLNDGSGDSNFANGANYDNGAPGAGTRVAILSGWRGNTSTPGIVVQGGSVNISITNTTANQSIGELSIFGNFDNKATNGTASGTITLAFSGAGSQLTVGNSIEINGGDTLAYSGNLIVQNGPILVGDGTTFDGGIVNPATAGNGTLILSSGSLNYSNASEMLLGSGAANAGFVVQGASSGSAVSVTAGNSLIIGAGGAGTYTINGHSTLQSGAVGGTVISIGQNSVLGTSGTGTLTINDFGTITLGSASQMLLGTSTGGSTGGSGVVNQKGAGSQVNLQDSASLVIGDTASGVGVYNLSGGQLNIGVVAGDTTTLDVGSSTGTEGTLAQSSGTLTALANSTVTIGDAGSGLYHLTGGTADFQNGFTLGAQATGIGTVLQSSGTLTVENAPVTIGVVGTGSYQLAGGSATFGDGIVVGATGSIVQTGGTLAVTGGTLDLSAVGSSYTLNGGTLAVGNTTLVGATGQGTFNFGSGTLQITSAGAFTEGLDGTLTGNGVIDAATTPGVTTVTMAGNLDGTGGITFEGGAGTTFVFSGTNSYTGTTSILSGTLDAAQADIASSSGLNIGSTGTLNLALANGGLAYGGTLSGSGAFHVNFATGGDALVLKNASGYSGDVTLGGAAGTLQVYSGHFTSIAGNGSGVTIGGTPLLALSGTPTTGTVTIDSATYTGPTLVSSNFTLNANTLTGAVTNNGSFFASGSGALTNNGTLGLNKNSAVGSTFNVNGALNLGTGSTLVIRASGTGGAPVADSIVASTTATVSATSIVKVTGSGNITTPIPIITGVTGAPANLPELKTGLLFQATLTLDPGTNSIDLTAVQNALTGFALTPNEAATAVPIDIAVANPGSLTVGQQNALNHLLTPLNNLPTAQQLAKALEELSPESLQYARNIAFENTTFLVQKMNGVDADLRSGYGGLDTNAISVVSPVFNNGLGRSMQSLFASESAFHQPAPNGVNYYPGGDSLPSASGEVISPSDSTHSSGTAPGQWNSSSQVISDSPNPYLAHQDPSSPQAPGFSEFISGDAVLADLNQNQSGSNAPSSSASYTAASATAGIAFRMTSHLAAGVLFDYNHTDARTDDSGSKTKVDTYSPGLFATYFDHGFYANGLFSFGYNNYANTRNISTLGETASSHPTGQQYVGDLDFGYDFHPAKEWVVGPTLGVTYTHLDIDSFRETGADGADLAVQSQSADSLRSRLGGHVIFQTNTGDVLLQPSFTAMWQHEFLDNSDGITSTFTDFSSVPFTINTAEPTRDSALLGLGLSATLNNSLAFYLNYFADVGFNDYFAQSVVGGFKTRF